MAENFSVAWTGELTRAGVLDTRAERRRVRAAIDRYDVVTPSPRSRITTLSGGNQQKVVLGRVLERDLEVLVLSEPTRGIDVAAKREIYRLIQGRAEQGAAIVVISSELPELLGIADRILVFFRGELRGEFAAAGLAEADVAEWRSPAPIRSVQLEPPTAGLCAGCRWAATPASSARCSSSAPTSPLTEEVFLTWDNA